MAVFPADGTQPWRQALLDWLLVGHNADGSLKGGGGGGLPTSVDDVTNSLVMGSNVLVDDGATDNSTALNNAYALVPTTGNGRAANFLFPIKNTGRYMFGSPVTISGGRAIRNIGVGSSSAHDGHYMTAFLPLASGFTMFTAGGAPGAVQQQGPSFEDIHFGNNAQTGITQLLISNNNRCSLYRVTFNDAAVGIETTQGSGDCAYQVWEDVQFYGNATGWLGTSANSFQAFGLRFTSCGIGADLIAVNEFNLIGAKIDTPLSGTPIGIRTRSYACSFLCLDIETGDWAGGSPIAIEVVGSGSNASPNSQMGNGNHFHITSYSGGGSANHAQTIVFQPGTDKNTWETNWSSGNSDQPAYQNNGLAGNRPIHGPLIDLAANKPISPHATQASWFLGSDDHKLYVADYTANVWRLVATTV